MHAVRSRFILLGEYATVMGRPLQRRDTGWYAE